MMPDTPRVAHAACGDDDVEAGQLGNCLALLDGLGEPELRRVQQPLDVDFGIETFGMLAKHLGGADRQRRIQENRGARNVAALHQVDQVDDELLGALDGKGWNQQRAFAGCGVADFAGKARATLDRRRGRPIPVAIGRLRDDIVEARWGVGIRLQQFGIGPDIAGCENANWLFQRSSIGALDLDRGGAEQMAGVPVARTNARNHIDPFFVFDRGERLQRGDGVRLGVDRRDFLASARDVAPIERQHLGFLDAAGVRQHVGT
jgi:hypothetical protein